MQTVSVARRHPWLEDLTANPAEAVDDLFGGVAYLPGLQRASPCEALMALLGDLPADAPECALVDRELRNWLERRRRDTAALVTGPGGVRTFIRETMEGIRAAWRLELPESSDWVRANLFDLLRWAEDLSVDATYDLARAVLTAGARLQRGSEFRFLWFRICEQAGGARLRHRLDPAMLGLTRLPAPSGPPSRDVIVGLARWASHLPADERSKPEVVREWRALKAAFPRLPGFWRGQWEVILEDSRYDHPFLGWLNEADPALKAPTRVGANRRAPTLPKNIQGTIGDMKKAYARGGLTEPLRLQMNNLLDQLERYADVTGEGYYLVTSCTNIASIILRSAPGLALGLSRRALLWAPSDGHAWSVRATALDALGRSDLAEAVLWEGLRRIPSNNAFHVELARKFEARGLDSAAEALLRKAIAINPQDETSRNELALLLWASGRAEEAIAGLRSYAADSVGLYSLGSLLVAEGQFAEAAGALEAYRRHPGEEAKNTTTLSRLIAMGAAGQQEARNHLLHERRRGNPGVVVSGDSALAVEEAEGRRLAPIARVSEADLRLRLPGAGRDEAVGLIDQALATDDSNTYAHVVKALAVPEYRLALESRAGRFAGSLPLQLAALPDAVAPERWHRLAEAHADGLPLIDLVRLARGAADDAVCDRLAAWTRTPSRWDESFATFLKGQMHAAVEGNPTLLPLAELAHDALLQAVDVGWDATPQAA